MLLAVILLSVLLIISIVANFLLWRAAEKQLMLKELYISWISEWRELVLKTHSHMKMLDDKQMFEKDDDVGIIFQDMKLLIDSLNDRTEEISEQPEE